MHPSYAKKPSNPTFTPQLLQYVLINCYVNQLTTLRHCNGISFGARARVCVCYVALTFQDGQTTHWPRTCEQPNVHLHPCNDCPYKFLTMFSLPMRYTHNGSYLKINLNLNIKPLSKICINNIFLFFCCLWDVVSGRQWWRVSGHSAAFHWLVKIV